MSVVSHAVCNHVLQSACVFLQRRPSHALLGGLRHGSKGGTCDRAVISGNRHSLTSSPSGHACDRWLRMQQRARCLLRCSAASCSTRCAMRGKAHVCLTACRASAAHCAMQRCSWPRLNTSISLASTLSSAHLPSSQHMCASAVCPAPACLRRGRLNTASICVFPVSLSVCLLADCVRLHSQMVTSLGANTGESLGDMRASLGALDLGLDM